jgi:hypothetical protein
MLMALCHCSCCDAELKERFKNCFRKRADLRLQAKIGTHTLKQLVDRIDRRGAEVRTISDRYFQAECDRYTRGGLKNVGERIDQVLQSRRPEG